MRPLNLDVPIRNIDGLYTDAEPEDLPPQFLTYAQNTQWINKNTFGKRNGITKLTWKGDGFLSVHAGSSTITKAKILDYGVFSARGSSQIYHIAVLEDKTPGAVNTGYIYIEIRAAVDDAIVNSYLLKHTEGGATKNANPVKAKLVQQLDRVFLADGSESKGYYLDISTDNNTTWVQLNLGSSVNAGFNDNDPLVDVSAYATFIFFLGSKGKAIYNEGIRDQLDFANGGFIEYNATNGLVAKDLQSSFLGLLILSESKPLNIVGSDLMTGTVPYSTSLPATESRGFDVKNLSFDISFLTGSTQNIDNNIYGLTQSGVVDLVTFIRSGAVNYNGSVDRNLQLEETLSYPIDDYIRRLNFSSENVFSCYHPRFRRYYFSAPFNKRNTSDDVYVYDYKYKVDVPRWSVWSLKINGINGMFTVLGKAFVADLDGELYELESGETDANVEFTGEFELASVGGDSFYYEKKWDGFAIALKTKADSEGASKAFNIFPISDEYLEVTNNYGENIKPAVLAPAKKFPGTFEPLYYFGRNRTFNDGGFGREIFFRKSDPYKSRTLRIAVEETIDKVTKKSAGPWTFKMAHIAGLIDSPANQR